MEIAYIVLAHKYPDQLVRLIYKLDTEKTSFFIHVDKKTDDETYYRMVRSLDNLPNVFFLKRTRVYWGHFGLLGATIQGLEEIFKRNVRFDYVVLLTGQCYPIMPNSCIEKTLEEGKPNSFMEYFALPTARWQDEDKDRGGLERIEYWQVRLFGRTLRFPAEHRFSSKIASLLWSTLISLFPIKRRFPRGFTPFGGSAHWCLSRDCADYINNFIKHNRAFVNFFKFAVLPEEIFFQTVILNSPFKDRVTNDDLRYIRWPENSDHPLVLRKGDFEDIARSSGLFARKFDITVDAEVLDLIDQKLLNK